MNNNDLANSYIKLINSALEDYVQFTGDEEDRVTEAMLYSLKIGGKRVRPMLVLEFCRVCGGDVNLALPFACALEMIHTYSLIHDDLPCMDDDDFRRGMPSCHKKYDYATALLAGDGLLTLAFSVVSGAQLPSEKVVKAVKLLADCAGYRGMIGGQTMDLQHEGQSITVEQLRKTDALKTGKLIYAACVLGCIAASADEKAIEAAKIYAENIGLAFQIVDDVLDITSTAEELGKPIGSDESNGKSTYPALLGFEKSKALVAQLTDEAVAAVSVFGEKGAFLADYARKLSVRTK
ncbi:MAG: polyprenyl synthetase family protein [Clostridia bacterium]|nr:polyprenyl synthetase family protein [Clostridia bacterium]